MILLNGNRYSPGNPFTDSNGNQYPSNWYYIASADERLAVGFTEEPDPPSVDGRFYYINTDGTVTQKSMTVCRDVIKSQLADLRWSYESKGIIYNNAVFATDDQSRVNYIGAVLQAQSNPDFTIVWKAKTDGEPSQSIFIELTANSLSYVTNSGIDYISKCFVNEATLRSQIDASTDLDELLAVDLNTGWPVQQY
jgi:hypothetical protein